MNPVRVVLADDHVIVRDGLKTLINAEPDMIVAGEAGTARAAFEVIERLAPHVAVIDFSMPDGNGAEVMRRVKQAALPTRVLALTVHEDPVYLREMLEAGAAGYVLKRAASAELIGAIRAVVEGGAYIDARVAGALVSNFVEGGHPQVDAANALSARETEVIRRIAQGFTNKEVASQLGLSAKTVETYKVRSMDKLGLRGRVALVQLAVDRGWLCRAL